MGGGPGLVEGLNADIGGVSVRLQASDPARARAMDFWNGLPASQEPPLLTLFYGSRVPVPPPGPPDETHDEALIWRSGDRLHIAYKDSVGATADAKHIEIGVVDEALYGAVNYLFPVTLAHSLTFSDRLMIYGGAIARDNRAVLILGDTGSGKSTAIMAAIANGWSPLSDDLVVLRRDSGTLRVNGVANQLHVPKEVLAGFPGAARQLEGDARGRWVVEHQGWAADAFEVSGTVLLRHGDDPGEGLGRLSRAVLARTALASFPGFFPGTSRPPALRPVEGLAAKLARLPRWDLPVPPEPSERLAGVASMLREVAAKLGLGR